MICLERLVTLVWIHSEGLMSPVVLLVHTGVPRDPVNKPETRAGGKESGGSRCNGRRSGQTDCCLEKRTQRSAARQGFHLETAGRSSTCANNRPVSGLVAPHGGGAACC